jgi:hypothetical protein
LFLSPQAGGWLLLSHDKLAPLLWRHLCRWRDWAGRASAMPHCKSYAQPLRDGRAAQGTPTPLFCCSNIIYDSRLSHLLVYPPVPLPALLRGLQAVNQALSGAAPSSGAGDGGGAGALVSARAAAALAALSSAPASSLTSPAAATPLEFALASSANLSMSAWGHVKPAPAALATALATNAPAPGKFTAEYKCAETVALAALGTGYADYMQTNASRASRDCFWSGSAESGSISVASPCPSQPSPVAAVLWTGGSSARPDDGHRAAALAKTVLGRLAGDGEPGPVDGVASGDTDPLPQPLMALSAARLLGDGADGGAASASSLYSSLQRLFATPFPWDTADAVERLVLPPRCRPRDRPAQEQAHGGGLGAFMRMSRANQAPAAARETAEATDFLDAGVGVAEAEVESLRSGLAAMSHFELGALTLPAHSAALLRASMRGHFPPAAVHGAGWEDRGAGAEAPVDDGPRGGHSQSFLNLQKYGHNRAQGQRSSGAGAGGAGGAGAGRGLYMDATETGDGGGSHGYSMVDGPSPSAPAPATTVQTTAGPAAVGGLMAGWVARFQRRVHAPDARAPLPAEALPVLLAAAAPDAVVRLQQPHWSAQPGTMTNTQPGSAATDGPALPASVLRKGVGAQLAHVLRTSSAAAQGPSAPASRYHDALHRVHVTLDAALPYSLVPDPYLSADAARALDAVESSRREERGRVSVQPGELGMQPPEGPWMSEYMQMLQDM